MPSVVDILEPGSGACRDRARQVLEEVESRRTVGVYELIDLVSESSCSADHALHLPVLVDRLVDSEAGRAWLSREGDDWLLEAGRPAPDWEAIVPSDAPSLRTWQREALDGWAEHGRIGVVEAVTGTGKSRLGVEAAREALAHDYSVLIAVPTRDLVQQWSKTLRAHGVRGVATVGDGTPASFGEGRDVLIGTVQALYAIPPTRPDGKVLLVADECHRYGAGQWQRVLHRSYRRRLGLTATFERNDDGLQTLLEYFGGTPFYRIGFDRAIADGVVARYHVKLHGVTLTAAERHLYDNAHETVVDCRWKLIQSGMPEEPFGLFMRAVTDAAEDSDGIEDPVIVDVSRRYLKNFHERIRILSESRAKITAARQLAPMVHESGGALFFTRTVRAAEEIASVVRDEGVLCDPIHSALSPAVRRERLLSLKSGGVKALAAPTVLDEGVDVPLIDLAVVMGGSKSRRQMIQRMGRVLRMKPDGRDATFVVVYAEDTVEDLTQNDGQEGCLDLIVQSADSVQNVSGAPLALKASTPVAARPDHEPERQEEEPFEKDGPDPATLAMTRSALNAYQQAHGGDDEEAESALRATLSDLLDVGRVVELPGPQGKVKVSAVGVTIGFADDRFQYYSCRRPDGESWLELKPRWAATVPARSPERWQELPWPTSPAQQHLVSEVAELGPLVDLPLEGTAVTQHMAEHEAGAEESERQLRLLVSHLDVDRDRIRRTGSHLMLGRSGYDVVIDRRELSIIGYSSSGQERSYGDYLTFGRSDAHLRRIPANWPEPDAPLDIADLEEFRDFVDPVTIYYTNRTISLLMESREEDFLNPWDTDRLIRNTIATDLHAATAAAFTKTGEQFELRQADRLWIFSPDCQSVKLRCVDEGGERPPERPQAAPEPPGEEIDEAAPGTGANATQPQASVDEPSPPPRSGSVLVAALAELAAMHREGILTDEEFVQAKGMVLHP